MISNPNGKLWKLANRLGQRCRFRYMLTGTPFGRDPTPLFGEFLIDHGETFNPTIGMFHAAFYDWKKGYFGGRWAFNKKTEPLLKRMVRNRALSFENVEFADMPMWSTRRSRWIRHQDARCLHHVGRGDATLPWG